MKDKLTAEEIAKKHYPDHKFEECEMSCMQCDNDVCESKDFARKELTKDINKLAESDLVSRKELLEWLEKHSDFTPTTSYGEGYKIALTDIISHLTQPKENPFNPLPDHPEKD